MNRQSFDTTTPNGRKHFQKLLDTLLDYNADGEEDHFNDIHIYQEESLIVVEWDNVPYNHEWGGSFKYIDYDEVVMKEVTFPDGHYEYLFSEEVEEKLQEWHKEHPEWVKTDYGTWTNMEENRRCNIDWNIDKWCERVEEPNDSTFKQVTLTKSFLETFVNEPNNIRGLITFVPDDVLYRTGYIVISPSLAKHFFGYPKEGRIHKLGDVDLTFDYKWLGNKIEQVTRTFKVYTLLDWPGKDSEMLFLTDTNYLICALRGE